MAKETKHNFHIANGDTQFLDNIAKNQGAGYTNESVQENYGLFKNQEKEGTGSKDNSLERELFNNIKHNTIPNENGNGHYNLDETHERKDDSKKVIIEPRHGISNNVVCATSIGSDQPAHTRSLIRAFASRLNIL